MKIARRECQVAPKYRKFASYLLEYFRPRYFPARLMNVASYLKLRDVILAHPAMVEGRLAP